MATIIISILLLAAFAFALYSILKKKGKNSCCEGCSGCAGMTGENQDTCPGCKK
ncbi:FeoB-associated Cys-rich membrane protein [Brucepastera parasyntrophica]|uniref:FeoB-associated Cys-rich membrane protein n=1 Tax=Brucepastera parasyntrophica TaxID=2880008 RepID=UPI00210E888B|nr:FeoB-associated Cys-rich membrane protein [Brucepastera parasyntrophica]ULQ58761.1 FeoB-associated Cys-rich membrane protein [Brucepastera parasyntrophica]